MDMMYTWIVALLIVQSCSGFASLKVVARTRSTYSTVSDELEKARETFESLVDSVVMVPNVSRPLTCASLRRRLVEMKLLDSLRDSDDAVDELMTLWMMERDAESAMRLQAMEQWCSDGLVAEEAALRDMITEYGVDGWTEPASRLAALLYFKGLSEESMVWADRVLKIKPWHFETVQIQILNTLRLSPQDVFKFARLALPPLRESTNNAARHQWVDRMLRQAEDLLHAAEVAGMTELHESEGGTSWQ